ncbi:hypothetical protein AB6B38_04925 [Glycocaulis abyssi]|uniref:Glycerophosphoryl diester phosphodiesterase membrane domain-containing protein n=1 Tax=Glycocaulis abyssi TaxID=1433403 RepID=A0ABV9NBN1_9PROT
MTTTTDAKYDFTSAAFWFFKCVGRNPGGAFTIALWQIIAYGVIVGTLLVFGLPAIQSILELAATTNDPDPSDVFAAAGTLLALSPVIVIASLVVALMAQAAWLRLMTRNEVAGGIPFRLGADEGRLLLVNLCLVAFVIAGYVAGALFFGLIVVTTMGINSAADGALWAALLNGLIWFIAVVGFVVAAIIICVRFAAGPALTVRQKGFRLFHSFAATKRIVGWLVLTYFVLILIAIGGSMVLSIVQQIAVMGGMMGAMAPFWADLMSGVDPDPQQVREMIASILTSPAAIIALCVMVFAQLVFQIAFEGLWHGVGAYAAVRHDGGDGPVETDLAAPAESVGNAPSEG